MRWNGRDFRKPENLSEHTHLVTVCALKIYDKLHDFDANCVKDTSVEKIVRMALIHDSLEILRGDILSITKDSVAGLRQCIDTEEEIFMDSVLGVQNCDKLTADIVKLADLMACYKYVERELSWPTNNYVPKAYVSTKEKYELAWKTFLINHNIRYVTPSSKEVTSNFSKGYEADAGVDIVLQEDVVFMPMSTKSLSLKVNIEPEEGTMAFLCSRSSAANRGLITANCPIDPNYKGDILAIVHNVSNDIIRYDKGDSFCQAVVVPLESCEAFKNVKVRKKGKRSDGKLGSTGLKR